MNGSKQYAMGVNSQQRLIVFSNVCQQLATAVSSQHIQLGCWQRFFSISTETVKSNLNKTQIGRAHV